MNVSMVVITKFKKKGIVHLRLVFSVLVTLTVFSIIFGLNAHGSADLSTAEFETRNGSSDINSNTFNITQETSPNYSDSLPDLFAKVEKSVVQITEPGSLQSAEANPSRLGSGFVYDKLGHIVTNFHVVDGSMNDKAYITFLDGVSYEGEIIGTDPYSDLAVVKLINVDTNVSSKLVPLALGNSSTVKIGEKVVAVGNPFGLSGSLSEGIISGLGRLMPVGEQNELPPGDPREQLAQNSSPSFSIPDIIQTDAAINPGNSGGPLIDMNGRVIGINTAIFSNTGVYSGIGFAIPSNFLSKIIPELIQKGSYQHPYIGINGFDITPEIANLVNLPEAVGFLVVNVTDGSPASRSGIVGGNQTVLVNGIPLKIGGDIITHIDDKSVRKVDDILSYLENHKKIGDNVNLTVLRGPNLTEKVISMNLTARPSHESDLNNPALGILGLDLSPQIANLLNLTQSDGFLITSIIENSSASKANLKGGYIVNDVNGTLVELGGDIITKIDNHVIKSQDDLREYLETKKIGDTLIITVLRNGEYKTIPLTLEQISDSQRRLKESIEHPSGQIPLPSQSLEQFLESCSKILSKEICESMIIPR
ncbi:MAG TPA: trypsin-like peptidase domain-containing protein [Candidatus Nitrosocosmicus sp.]|nr:trypsin-like peptidase domain-containing protein [Candidatus Nitrosocosmicus sp.]